MSSLTQHDNLSWTLPSHVSAPPRVDVSVPPRVDVSVPPRVDVSVPPRESGATDAQIISEDYQNLLIYYRDQMTEAYFGIGDVANQLIGQSVSKGLNVTEQRIFEAVGHFCGKSARTVRYYSETSAFYPQNVRMEYEMLPFSHFVFARSLGEYWKGVLNFSMDNPGMSLEALRQKFLPPRDSSVDVSASARANDDLMAALERLESENVAVAPISQEDRRVASGISKDMQNYVAITKLSDFVTSLNDVARLVKSIAGLPNADTILADIERVRAHISEIAVAIMPNQRPS